MESDVLQGELSEPTVLLVDDCEDVHRLLSVRLRSEPFKFECAGDGELGIKLAKELDPDLVLLDLDMPEIDGFEVLRRLKDDPATSEMAVIVLSGLHSPQDKVTAFDLGAVDYVTKPFEMTELRVRIRAALRMQRLMAMLAQRAQVDGLTGLWNRAHFDRRWAEEVSNCGRNDRPLSIALIDIDHFKSVNDTFGHPAGDAVILGLAEIIRKECREADIPCRYGGEEFCLIMPETAPNDAVVVCERILEKLRAQNWPRHPERKITASFGIAGVEGTTATDAAEWLERADKTLYEAKTSGRNRVLATDLLTGKVRLAEAG